MELIRTNTVLSHSFSCLDPYSLAPKVTGWSWPVCPHCFFVFFENFALNSFYSLLFLFRSERKISINYCVHKMWNTHAALMEFLAQFRGLPTGEKLEENKKALAAKRVNSYFRLCQFIGISYVWFAINSPLCRRFFMISK